MRLLPTSLVILLSLFITSVGASPYQHGSEAPAGVGGAFELRDMYGRDFNLKKLGRQPALLFFGFAGCSSTCPVAMATARQLLRDASLPAQPAVLFVTLDPLGDSPKRMQQYLGAFDSRILGLTGDPQQLSKVLDQYGVAVQSQNNGLSHSSMWYLVNSTGKVLRVYRHSAPAMELAADLRALPLGTR